MQSDRKQTGKLSGLNKSRLGLKIDLVKSQLKSGAFTGHRVSKDHRWSELVEFSKNPKGFVWHIRVTALCHSILW